MKMSRMLSGVVCCLALVVAAAADGWEYSLTPYVWATGVDGTVGVAPDEDGGITVDVDASFSDILDNLETAIPIHFEAKAPVWTLIAEVNFVSIGQELGAVAGSADFEMLIAELLAGWQWTESVEVLFGSRYYDYDVDIRLDVVSPSIPDGRVNPTQSWVDPVVGIRYGGQLNRRGTWHSSFRADVGGFGLGSELTWNVRANLGYDFGETVRLVFGYHWMDIDYDDKGLVLDELQQGPEVGLSFRW